MRILTVLLALAFTFSTTAKAVAASLDTEDKMVMVMLLLEEDEEDDVVVTSIYTSFLAAQKVAQILDVEMSMSDDPIADDVFVFGLKSQDQKDLAMRIFDEEGYEMANNSVEIIEGSNYRALDVKSLPDGTYTFELTGDNGARLTKEIVIERD